MSTAPLDVPAALAPARRRAWQSAAKRTLDVALALLALVLLAPFLLLIAGLILALDGRPVFFPWHVLGEDGQPFTGYKFRTMVREADRLRSGLASNNEMAGPVFKMRADPRVTRLGAALRRWSLDELPQLWSVVRGDMSLVGPRPLYPHEYERATPAQRRKLSVKPGITCLWQVMGRNEIRDFERWVELDLAYIDSWSLALDLKILALTVPAVLTRRGAW